jgi:uncharacterized protein with GYD domain
MPQYLVQVAYSTEGWATLLNKPQDRAKAVGASIASLGGKVIGWWMAFGDYDVVLVIEMPDNQAAAGLAMAVAAGGACRTVKTTPLLSIAEGVAAMQKAAACGYKPPS